MLEGCSIITETRMADLIRLQFWLLQVVNPVPLSSFSERSLVLSRRLPNGRYQTTWAFVLEQPQPDHSRLLIRAE